MSASLDLPPAVEEITSEIELVLLLVSGKRKAFNFSKDTTVAQVKRHVLDNWPKEWEETQPTTIDALKIVYLGKFLEDDSTLEANKINPGQTTIAHMTIKSLTGTVISEDEKIGALQKKSCCACTVM